MRRSQQGKESARRRAEGVITARPVESKGGGQERSESECYRAAGLTLATLP
jgi:hypothetical protein